MRAAPAGTSTLRRWLQAGVVAASALAFVAPCVFARTAARPWPAPVADLPADPALRTGTLPNGLRYLVYPSAEPKGHTVLRLIVAAGSRNEEPGQYGVAHLIEHLAFRSARSSDSGPLVNELERMGVGFGPNNTAYTFYDSTLYMLELPRDDRAFVEKGLRVFRTFADGIRFSKPDVELEKGVVLSEEKMHRVEGDTAAFAYHGFLWPSVSSIGRPIGGDTESISALTARDCSRYYKAWYRPDRMAVVVVGSMDPDMAVQAVKEVFGSLKGRGSEPDLPPPAPAESPAARVQIQRVTVANDYIVCLSHSWIEAPSPYDHERRLRELRLNLALTMLQQRLTQVCLQPGSAVNSPRVQLLVPYPALGFRAVQLGLFGSPQAWQSVIATAMRELRRARERGFTAEELTAAKAIVENSFREAVRSEPARRSPFTASALLYSLQAGFPFPTPRTMLAEGEDMLAHTTVADCNAEFQRAWGAGPADTYLITTPALAGLTRELSEVIAKARTEPLAAESAVAEARFDYDQFGPSGKLAEERHVKDLDVWQDRFQNGVRLNFKHTDFDANAIQIYVRVGTGRLALPNDQPGLALMSQLALLQGGLGRDPVEQIAKLFASHSIAMNFYVTDDALAFGVGCSRKDLGLALKLVAAYMSDAALRASAMPAVRSQVQRIFDSAETTPQGGLASFAERQLACGDRRFGLGARPEALDRTVAEVRAFLQPQLKNGPVEMSIVGDVDYASARDAVAATLGALPQRDERPKSIPDHFTGFSPAATRYLTTSVPILQDGQAYFFPVADCDSMKKDRRLRLAAAVIDERLRTRLRDKLGVSYVSNAGFVSHDGFPSFAYLEFYTQVAPELMQQTSREVQAEFDDLAAHGVSEDEFQRARNPWLTSYDSSLRDNGYWCATVLANAQQRPENLDAARNRTADTHAITRQEIEQLLRTYLAPQSMVRLFVVPSSQAPRLQNVLGN